MKNWKQRICSLLATGTAAVFMTLQATAADGATASGTAGAANTTGGMLLSILPFGIAILLMYLILFRPQRKKEKEAQSMRENVRIGDEVCTAGGIVGIVIRITDDTVVLETGGERSKIRVRKWAIHENITQIEEAQAAEKERKAARQRGITTGGEKAESKKKKAEDF